MIFYFSGTGNSRWVAEQLAQLTGDESCDITALTEVPEIQNEKQIGFVFPVYAWGAPEPVVTFAKKLKATNGFTFGVCTCGSEAGLAMKHFSAIYPLDSSYSLVMPNNYIIGSDTDEEEVILKKIHTARRELQRISEEILQRKKAYRVQEGVMARLKSGIVNFGFNRFARRTDPFSVTESCNSCGLCAKDCPASSITLADGGLPVWGKECCQCLRCINRCPRQAIQYGKSTAGRQRYTIWQYLPENEKNRL